MTEEKRHERRRESDNGSHWHLEKTVSVGHIITTLTVAGSVMMWALHMDTRVSLLEAALNGAKETDARIEMQVKDGMSRVENTLIRIEQKIDSKADKR